MLFLSTRKALSDDACSWFELSEQNDIDIHEDLNLLAGYSCYKDYF